MQRSFLEDFFDGMNEKLFFLLIIVVQVVFIFQGLEFTDSGFNADFYSRIFSDPATVQYNFTSWFSGIIGGLWLKLFPGLGLLGLRIAGVLFTTLTFLLTYDLLKKYLHTGPLRLSLFLIILFLTTSVKELNHNDISAFFFVCAVWFLFAGLTKEKFFLIFLSGLFVSVNTFSSLPNLLGLALIAVIWFYAYLNRDLPRMIIYQSFIFIIGFIFTSAALVILMLGLHHDVFFRNSFKIAQRITGNLENPLSFFQTVKIYFFHYAEALSIAMIAMVVLWSSSAAWRRMKADIPSSIPFLRVIKYGVLFLLSAICIFYSRRDPDFWYYLYLCYAGLGLIVGFLIITGRQPKNLRLLAAIGCLMLLLLPVGSRIVLMETGKYAIWIIVPITVDFLLNIRALSSRVVVSENTRHSYEQVIDEKHMTGLRNACIYLTLIFIVSITYYYPHFDRSDRIGMHYHVNNKHTDGIYTSESRARVVNDLLSVSAKYLKPDDYALAFDCMPMFYYLTDTKPYVHNSWIRLYDGTIFKEELNRSFLETQICPVVVMQKGNTLGANWPDFQFESSPFNPEVMKSMQVFFKEHHYTQVWENNYFSIYTSADKSPVIAKNFFR